MQPTAAIIIIGDEILSGRTADKNINWLASVLYERGIKLSQARVIGDDEALIIETVKALSLAHDIVFTSGGIGPTHDDITTASIAKAFGVKVIRHPEADQRLIDHYTGTGLEYNAARQKMADIPEGAELIDNPVSAAPGFIINNVYVLPGVPSILQAMVENMGDQLPGGTKAHRLTVQTDIGEGSLAEGLARIEAEYEGISVGSYPWFKPGTYGTALVVTGLDLSLVEAAAAALVKLVESFGGTGFIDEKVVGGNTP
ncbi:competence/damage-inducible protein A [Alphaproteobacteria bacterium LSUCC0684]